VYLKNIDDCDNGANGTTLDLPLLWLDNTFKKSFLNSKFSNTKINTFLQALELQQDATDSTTEIVQRKHSVLKQQKITKFTEPGTKQSHSINAAAQFRRGYRSIIAKKIL
jgi:hypothetical protein